MSDPITLTPENPIPDVDEIKPGIPSPAWPDEGGGSGTGGGVLKVKMTWNEDYSSCTLDKTYAEIYSACQNGVIISIGEEADTGALSLWMVCEVGYINETYSVGILPMHNLQSGPEYFIAETENSYPVCSE